ncbi:MAG TPA: sensor histidine kinase [Magnetospirillum sp.]|nr:sensor histidine kinase [Magnetospirillum sp.]
MVIVLSLWAGQASRNREIDLDRAEVLVGSLATVAENQVDGTMRTIDAFLSEAANRVVPGHRTEAEVQDWLAVRLEGIPEIRHVVIADAAYGVIGKPFGRDPIISSAPLEGVADRDFIERTKGGAGSNELVISRPRVSPLSGLAVIPMAKAMQDARGRIIGWVIAEVRPEVFRDQLASVSIEEEGGAALFGQGAVFLARVPRHEHFLGYSFANNPLTDEVVRAQPKGVRRFVSPADGHAKVVAYRQLERFPLLLTVGVTEDTALKRWRKQLQGEGVVIVVFFAIIFWVAHVHDRRSGLHRQLAQHNVARREKAERLLEERTRFFAEASHDLRQPVHTLRLLTAAMKDMLGDGNGLSAQEFSELVAEVEAAGANLSDFIGELLDISRFEAGAIQAAISECRLQPIFDDLIRQFQPLADTADVRLHVVPTSCVVTTDPVLFRRVLCNLLSNAIKFADGGAVLLGCRRRGGEVLVQVCDSGVGIPAESIALIFEDFHQLDNAAGRREHGVGLGLAIVRRILRLLSHPLEVRSVVGKGTIFSVTLPCVARCRRI